MTAVLEPAPPLAAPVTPRARRLLRGRAGDPAWARPGLLALLAGTALLYLWGLGASGWANGYYSAAVQAGTQSWKAFFFGSFDAASFITVDKPPASLWVMELSARVFGLNAWSVLVPQALEGVAAVWLLHATVRRRFTPQAGLLAGAVLALTPVSALMFRFNNTDALLVLLLVGGAYALTRALESASTRWLLLSAALVGTGFLAKMLQAFLVVPVFALVYLVCADTPVRRRLLQLVAAGAALVAAAGWWVAVVSLVPASARPYIGGSQHNSVWELVWGYNGLGRITGNETGSVVPGGQGRAGMWGATGITRMFGSEFGGQVSWLLPPALVLLAGLLWLSRRAPRTSGQRAQVLLWGGWLLVTGLTFSYMQGIIHPYYAVALAPAIGALVGIGATELWRARRLLVARLLLAGSLAASAWWSSVLLDRSASWHPWLRPAVLVAGAAAALGVLAAHLSPRRVAAAVAGAGLLAVLAGPTAYALQTASTPHSGSLPSAGPAVAGGLGRPGGGPAGGPLGMPPVGAFRPAGPTGGGPGGGGLLSASRPSAEVVSALRQDAGRYTWAAAAVGANNAAGYQLASGEPVLAVGGFNGSDPSPTLAQFQQLVRAGRIHWFVAGGVGGPGGASGTTSQISSWVQQTFTATTVGGVTMYDLSSGS